MKNAPATEAREKLSSLYKHMNTTLHALVCIRLTRVLLIRILIHTANGSEFRFQNALLLRWV